MEYPGGEKRLVKLASKGSRVGAYFIDNVIAGIPMLIVMLIMLFQTMPRFIMLFEEMAYYGNFDDPSYLPTQVFNEFFSTFFLWIIGITVISAVIQILYYGVIPVLTKGQTLGKKMLKMRAVSEDGHYLSTGGQLLRGAVGFTLLSIFTSGITIWVSAVMILVTDKRQGIHDYMAGSLVISEKAF